MSQTRKRQDTEGEREVERLGSRGISRLKSRVRRKRSRTRRRRSSTDARVNKFQGVDRAINKIARRIGPGRRMNLGPMGPLGNNIIISIDINPAFKIFLKTVKKTKVKIPGLESEQKVYGSIWTKMMFDLIQFGFKRIDLNVPAMTKGLRNSMKDSIKVRATGTFPMVMELNTKGINYAGPVNKMPEAWLRHPPNKPATRKKGGKRYLLFDPAAKKGWFQLTQLQAQNEAKKLWESYIRKTWIPLFKKLGVKNPRGESSKLFKIRPTRLKF